MPKPTVKKTPEKTALHDQQHLQFLATLDFLSQEQTAQLIGVTVGTLEKWRSTKQYALPFVKIGRIKYRRSDVLQFLESRIVNPHAKKRPGRKKAA